MEDCVLYEVDECVVGEMEECIVYGVECFLCDMGDCMKGYLEGRMLCAR